jgi:cytochrome b561
VAHEYSDKLWNIHKYIGFGLSFLFVWRLTAEFVITKNKKINQRIKFAKADSSSDKKHYLMVQYGYLIFYSLFLIMVSTGLILAFEEVELFKSIHKLAKNIHSLCQWGMYGFMLFHITGVVLAECGDYSGIVSRMINGKEVK